jgi:hydrogenase maturation protease
MRTLLIGVGAPLRGDDSVGLHVVRRLVARGLPPGWAAAEVSGDWLALVDRLAGAERLVVVDAWAGHEAPGTIVEWAAPTAAEARATPPLGHGVGLVELLGLAELLGIPGPIETRIFGIQVADLSRYSEHCSPAVAAAIDEACARVLALG